MSAHREPERYAWVADDDDAGPIDCVLDVANDGSGVLSLNGQAHLPISPEGVRALIAALLREHWR